MYTTLRGALLLLLLALPLCASTGNAPPEDLDVFRKRALPLVLDAGREVLAGQPLLDAAQLERLLQEDILQEGPYCKSALEELGGLDRLSRNQVIALCFVAGLAAGLLLL